MTNGEKYKTLQERQDAFKEFCQRRVCSSCPATRKSKNCILGWLELECKGKVELSKCPFCGGEAKIIDFSSSYITHVWIECPKCLSRTVAFCNKEEAITAWNRRV